MHKLTITGASDDLIEIEGDISEEFNVYGPSDDEESFLAISDGTLLRVLYDNGGIWRFYPITKGTANFSKTDGVEADDTFDVVTLESDKRFEWVLFGSGENRVATR